LDRLCASVLLGKLRKKNKSSFFPESSM